MKWYCEDWVTDEVSNDTPLSWPSSTFLQQIKGHIIERTILTYSNTVLLQYSSVTCSPFQLLCFTTVFGQQCLPGFTFSLEPKTKYRSLKKKETSWDIFIFKAWIYDLKKLLCYSDIKNMPVDCFFHGSLHWRIARTESK